MILMAFLLSNCHKTTDGSTDSNTTVNDSTTSLPTSTSSDDYPDVNHFPMDPKYNPYYSSINFSLPKAELKNALSQKISGHTKLSYDGARDAMKQTDRNWDLSPNSSDSNPYMHLLYATYNHSASTAKKFSDNNTVWDREHVWAKAHGDFSNESIYGTDLHHLHASDKNNNNKRGNLDFAVIVSSPTNVSDYSGKASGKTGTASVSGSSGSAYEPQNCDKGDIARSMFYMATRYAKDNLQFTLVDGFTSQSSSNARFGVLSQLIKWHSEDPVDEYEMNRNDIIYDSFQKNRNPFIDYPNLVYMIFA